LTLFLPVIVGQATSRIAKNFTQSRKDENKAQSYSLRLCSLVSLRENCNKNFSEQQWQCRL